LAAVGRSQLERLDAKVARRKAIKDFYRNALQELPGIEFMPEAPYGKSNGWLTVILIHPQEFGADREQVRLALEAENIEKPMPMQPVFKDCRMRGGEVSEYLFETGLCLPSGTQMTDGDLERVVNIIKNCHRRNKS
jgi:dTDP-4-amino-4,6-dideoxygalactose transaminase